MTDDSQLREAAHELVTVLDDTYPEGETHLSVVDAIAALRAALAASSEFPLCGAILNCALPTNHDGLHERGDGIRWSWHENIDHLPTPASERAAQEATA